MRTTFDTISKGSNYYEQSNNKFIEVFNSKGLTGEYIVFNKLNKLPGYKRIIVNSYLPCGNGKFTEVDLILIHETGIYCIESKNYGGTIQGHEKWNYWNQRFFNGDEFQFYNPLMQNEGHIRHLKPLISKKYDVEIHSVIVFSDRSNISNVKLISNKAIVTNHKNFISRISECLVHKISKLSTEDVDKIYNELSKYANVTKEEKLRHIKNC